MFFIERKNKAFKALGFTREHHFASDAINFGDMQIPICELSALLTSCSFLLQGNPVSEALFNFVNAWSLMFWPLLLSDAKRDRTEKKILWWTGIMVRIKCSQQSKHSSYICDSGSLIWSPRL